MIKRLDYKYPPPGYSYAAELGTDAIQTAWVHYAERHDPPGLSVGCYGGSVFWVHDAAGSPLLGPFACGASGDERRGAEIRARAAAWACYDRRHKLAIDLEEVGVQITLWPAVLSFTDGDCAACESWLTRGPAWEANDFPTVLKALARPCGPHCDCEANGHG